jgi:hypothetical protein
LLSVECIAFSDLAANLNHSNLNNNCKYGDTNENPVSENTCKDIEFPIKKKSCIELVEQLHEDENLENECEEQKLLSSDTTWNIKWGNCVLSNPLGILPKFFACLSVVNSVLVVNFTAEFF